MTVEAVSIILLTLGPFVAGIGVGMMIEGRRKRVGPTGPPPPAIFGPLGSRATILPPAVAIEVLERARAGAAVDAVKQVSDATGLDLAAAKEVVDDMRRHDRAAR